MVTKDHLHCLLGLWMKKQIWMMELVCYRNNVKNSYAQQVKISYMGNTSSSSQPSYIDLEALGFLLSMCGSSVQGTAIYSHWDDDLRFLQSTLKDREQILLKADWLWRARHHTAEWNRFSEEQKSRQTKNPHSNPSSSVFGETIEEAERFLVLYIYINISKRWKIKWGSITYTEEVRDRAGVFGVLDRLIRIESKSVQIK